MMNKDLLVFSCGTALLSVTVCLVCVGLAACGGGGRGSDSSSEVTLGGARCESGVAFNDGVAQGYDVLYNFQNQAHPAVSVEFDADSQPAECASVATINDVVPWIRVDSSDPLDSSKGLRFELLSPGGRNEPVLAEYPILDTAKESIRGSFAYTVVLAPSGGNNGTTCEVNYKGAYCPMAVSENGATSRALDFSAKGSVDCSVAHVDGTAPTQCHGTISATNATLYALFYGE